MNWLKQHSAAVFGFIAFFVLAYCSIQVRKENLQAPLGRHHEWITAHTLLTTTIWEKGGGPSNYHFNPIYTIPGKGNHYRNMLGGVVDENGDVYYVSYPPFSFIFYYYCSQLLGGTSVFSIRIITVMVHIVSALILFFLIKSINTEDSKFNLGGIIAAGFYLLSSGNLWYHGNLYFADILVQPLIFSAVLIAIKIKLESFKDTRFILMALFITLFLATYTEWLGLFTAFFIGIIFLVKAISKKNRLYYKVFITAAIASTTALCLTIYQFSSIAGWSELKEVSLNKYSERSGYNDSVGSAIEFNINDGTSIDRIIGGISSEYKYLIQFLVVAAILLTVVMAVNYFRKNLPTKKTLQNHAFLLCILLVVLPILLHYFLFFNFNSIHNFSVVKTAGVLCIIAGIISQKAFNLSLNQGVIYGTVTTSFLLIFMIFKLNKSSELYTLNYPLAHLDQNRILSAKVIKETANPDIAVFTNVHLTPEYVYYSNHISTPLMPNNPDHLGTMIMTMKMFGNTEAKLYQHKGSILNAIIDIQLQGDNLVFLDTLIIE